MANTDVMENDIFNVEQTESLNQLLHGCIDEICGYPGPNFEDYKSTGWHQEQFQFICKLFSCLLRNPATFHFEEEKMPVEFCEFPEFLRTIFMNSLESRKEQLIDTVIRDISKNILPTVCNFDWKVKQVIGSSALTSLREPLLQLDLLLGNKDSENNLCLEMAITEVDLLIKTLNEIRT